MYSPKIWDALFTGLVMLGCMLAGIRFREYQTAYNIAALLFAIVTAVILWVLVVDNYRALVMEITDFARVFGALDDEARQAVGLQFPTLRYQARRGVVRGVFEDTNVPIELFRLFLQDSNQKQIAPERNWNSRERPRWAWLEIKSWLEDNGDIIPESAAGSHSWLWVVGRYQKYMLYWMAGRNLADMNA